MTDINPNNAIPLHTNAKEYISTSFPTIRLLKEVKREAKMPTKAMIRPRWVEGILLVT